MITYSQHKYLWQPMNCENRETLTARLARILKQWEGTPYGPFRQTKGRSADCVGFICAVLNELYGMPETRLNMPSDIEFKSRLRAKEAIETIKENYPHIDINGDVLEPGDVVVLGNGVVHAMIVGPQKNTIWHTTQGTGVCWSGLIIPSDKQIIDVFRCSDRDKLWS